MKQTRTRGFTLIEVLVVVAIMALLMGIMMPSLKEVRRLSKRTVCQKNMDQIGVGIHAYLMTNKDRFFTACRLPTYEEQQYHEQGRAKPWPAIHKALHNELKGTEVFACPADRNTMSTTPSSSDPDDLAMVVPTVRYYDSQRTSYEWESRLNSSVLGFRFAKIHGLDANRKEFDIGKVDRKNMWMLFDYEAFHGGPTMVGSHNVLYTDLHVQSDKWTDGKTVGKEYNGAASPGVSMIAVP